MIAEKYDDLKSPAQQRWSDVGDYVQRGGEQFSQMVDHQPARTLAFSCLAGFAVGLLLSRAFASEEETCSVSASSAERFGRNLLNKIEQAMPTMLRERLSH